VETLTTQTRQKTDYKDVYQTVTDTIIQQLEKGTIPWHQPWTGANSKLLQLPRNFETGKKYRGVNILLLWCAALNKNYDQSEWATYKQWEKQNEFPRAREKSSKIVKYDTIKREEDGEIKEIPFLKVYNVFNRCQLQSYNPPAQDQFENLNDLVEKIDVVDEFIANTKAMIRHSTEGAHYNPNTDEINIPFPELFKATTTCSATEGLYSTTLHELTHWTGGKHRLNRLERCKFGDKKYAAEELIAELGAAFLCSGFDIATVEKGDHAGYIDHWLKILKEDNHFIIKVASEASKAVDHLENLQPK